MAVLLVDIGNTRIKWASLEGRRIGRCRAATHAGWSASTYARRLLRRAPHPQHVWVSSVAGPAVNRALASAARRAGVALTFVAVPRKGGGVRVAYLEPWRLGVDRFVAAVGAHALFPHAEVCVVGVGTAMTVDVIAADGRHRGGVIVPGPALMVETLFTRTHGIHRRAQGGRRAGARSGLFARSTRAGVIQGARYAAAALIDRAVEETRAVLGRRPLVVLSGGGARLVKPVLESRCVLVPDLVLRGLAVLARDSGPSRRQSVAAVRIRPCAWPSSRSSV